MTIGTVHEKKALFMTQYVGEAIAPDGTKLSTHTSFPAGEPVIRHEDGRYWTMNWQEMCNQAGAAFDANTLQAVAESGPCQGSYAPSKDAPGSGEMEWSCAKPGCTYKRFTCPRLR